MAMSEDQKPSLPNTEKHYDVTRADLPVSCPMPDMPQWNSHPKVYISLEETGEGMCAYCSATFKLVD